MALPDALAGLAGERLWVAWDDEGGRKVPKSPHGGNAKSNDPATWGTYAQAEATARENGYSGVGIMLADGLVGIDLDGAVEGGEVAGWAREIVELFGSYTEVSPSGAGLHILAWADLGEVGAIGAADRAAGVEIYNNRRYFTVTGDAIGESGLTDVTARVAGFMERWLPGRSSEDRVRRAVGSMAADQVKRLANRTMADSCARDGVRYARVPTGAETCGFCLMLASRGFVYHTSATAGELDHYHRSCDCKVVAGFDGLTEVEGYDPDALYGLYSEARSRLGGHPGAGEVSREIERVLAEREEAEAERSGREGFDIPIEKLTGYALNPEHPSGKDKAAAFESALGFTASDADEIMRQVYAWVGKHELVYRGSNGFGDLYVTDMEMTGSNGKTARVMASWIREPGSSKMRLTSVYIKNR